MSAFAVMLEAARLEASRRALWPQRLKAWFDSAVNDAHEQLKYWMAHDARVEMLPEDLWDDESLLCDVIVYWSTVRDELERCYDACQKSPKSCWMAMRRLCEKKRPAGSSEFLLPEKHAETLKVLMGELCELHGRRELGVENPDE